MTATVWALLLKPFIGIAILAVMYFGSHWIAAVIRWLMPNGRVKDYLFDGWDDGHSRNATSARDEMRYLTDDGSPLIGREPR